MRRQATNKKKKPWRRRNAERAKQRINAEERKGNAEDAEGRLVYG
jgi:hypothetical protein